MLHTLELFVCMLTLEVHGYVVPTSSSFVACPVKGHVLSQPWADVAIHGCEYKKKRYDKMIVTMINY